MIDFVKIQKAIGKWFEKQTGLRQVVWDGDDRPMTSRPFGELFITNVRSVGTDMNLQEYDATQPAGKELVSTIAGNRQFILQCKVTSRKSEPNEKALYFIEKARTSLKKPSVIEAFSAADLSVGSILGSISTLNPYQKRAEQVATLDIQFNTCVNETDSSEEGTFIETILVSSDMDLVPDDHQLADEEMPS
jgi:hypothetical protein